MIGGIVSAFALILGFVLGVLVKDIDVKKMYGLKEEVKVEHKVEVDKQVEKAIKSGKYKHIKTWKIYKKTR